MNEHIACAAIRYEGLVCSVPCPGRHGDVISRMRALGLPRESVNVVNQGFLTSTGRFVDRQEAAKIAGMSKDQLFTEDMW